MKENTKLPLVLAIALPILLIISTELARVSISVAGQQIYVITFILPIIALVSILISKITQSKNAITLVILALIIESLVFVLKWTLWGKADYVLMEVTFLSFFLSQFLLLLGYEALKERKRTGKYGYVLFILLISMLIETMFYVMIFTNITIISLIINIAIKIVFDLIITKILVK